jgi:hypothetical protein
VNARAIGLFLLLIIAGTMLGGRLAREGGRAIAARPGVVAGDISTTTSADTGATPITGTVALEPTLTPTVTVTVTPIVTDTVTPIVTDTAMPTSSATVTMTASATVTASATATATASATATATSKDGPSPTATSKGGPSPTATSKGAIASATATSKGGLSPTGTDKGALSPTPTSIQGGSTTAYFAEGYTGVAATNGRATFTEVLNLLNPSATTLVANITYYIQGVAKPVGVSRSIGPSSVVRESVTADVGPDKTVAAVVQSPQRLFVTRTITRVAADGTRLDGSTTLAVSTPGQSWYFPEGYTGATFQEYLTILNPSSVAAKVSILLAPQAANASGAKTVTLTVPALSRATANIRALNPTSAAKAVGMIISSDQPIVPERVIYFGDGSGSGKFGATVSGGVITSGTHLRLAFASSGGLDATGNMKGNQAFLTVLNPAASGPAIKVVATFYDAAGHGIGSPAVVTVSPSTRQTIDGNKALGSAVVSDYSVELTASGVIAVESAQYYDGSPNLGRHPGVDYPAQSTSSGDVFLSDLSTQLVDGTAVNRLVYLYNPGTKAIQVGATYYGSNGSTAQGTYVVAAGGITTVDVVADAGAGVPPGPVGAEFKATSGSFVAYGIGRTADGLSATEDAGTPLLAKAGVPFP